MAADKAAMELTIAALVLVSATLHPIWNALAKGDEHPEWVFFSLLVLTSLCAAAHGLLVGIDLMSITRVWPMALLSAGGVLLYGVTLVLTLRRGDLSIYYPIIRSSPLFIVCVGFFVLGERYSGILLLGIASVLVGAFYLQYRRGAHLLEDSLTLGFAVLAMVGTGIYSIADALGVQRVEPMVMFFWSTFLALPFFTGFLWRLYRGRGEDPGQMLLGSWKARPWHHLAAGLLSYVSYFLILTAYQLGGNVAAVTSLRQASIPISVLLGGLYLREKGIPARLFWSLVLAGGIVTIITAH
jgi:drug/metabolite transporter (DMT)-like permease